MILAIVTEYDNKYVTETDAEMLLGRIEEQVRDWFYENIHVIVEQEIDKHIHEVMNSKRGEK